MRPASKLSPKRATTSRNSGFETNLPTVMGNNEEAKATLWQKDS